MIYPLWLGILAASLCFPAPTVQSRIVTFKTSDGWTLAARWRPPHKGRPLILLAHGVGSSKNEWEPLTEKLAAKGIGTLAIDLRGHGGSLQGPQGRRDYRDFDETGEWPLALEDFMAARRWLKGRGISEKRTALGGASIGANLASLAAEREPRAPFLLLLSPGANYRGVPLKTGLRVKTLVAAAPDDTYSFEALEALSKKGAAAIKAPGGHGTQMFADPATLDQIAAWVIAASRAP